MEKILEILVDGQSIRFVGVSKVHQGFKLTELNYVGLTQPRISPEGEYLMSLEQLQQMIINRMRKNYEAKPAIKIEIKQYEPKLA